MHYRSKEGGFAPADFVKSCKDVFQFWVPNTLGYPRARTSYRNGRNTEALVIENLEPVEIT